MPSVRLGFPVPLSARDRTHLICEQGPYRPHRTGGAWRPVADLQLERMALNYPPFPSLVVTPLDPDFAPGQMVVADIQNVRRPRWHLPAAWSEYARGGCRSNGTLSPRDSSSIAADIRPNCWGRVEARAAIHARRRVTRLSRWLPGAARLQLAGYASFCDSVDLLISRVSVKGVGWLGTRRLSVRR